MQTVLTNTRCYIMHLASCIAVRKLRFGMLTALTNKRSTKVLWQVEDDLWWKTTFYGRQPSVEQPLVEENLQWRTTFGGRRLSLEDDLQWKMTFG